MLKAMVEAAGSAPSLREVGLLAGCLVAFSGSSGMISLKCADVTFNAECMVVKMEPSKKDQYQDGAPWLLHAQGR